MRSYLVDVRTFFPFAVKQKYVSENPALAVDSPRLDEKPPGIITPPQVRALLEACLDFTPDILPVIVLTLFGGLRRAEAEKIEWEEIGVEFIEVKAHKAKTRRRRLVPVMHRIRFAMTPDLKKLPKLKGTVEADEMYVGGKPRPGTGPHPVGRGTKKTPVLGIVERGGNIHRRVVTDVSGPTLKGAIRECVDKQARIVTDEHAGYTRIGREFAGGHATVCHSAKEYARGDIFTNTAESSFALIKRGMVGVYHAVSKKHLPRYLAEFDFRWNTRRLNDGERTTLAIQSFYYLRTLLF